MSNVRLRAGAGAVVALAATSVLGNAGPLFWYGGMLAVLLLDYAIHARLLKQCAAGQAPAALAPLMLWTATQSAYGNLIAVMLWAAKYVHGEALAVLYLLASLANAAATLRSSTPLAAAGGGATALILLGLPLYDYVGGGGNELDLAPCVGALLMLGFGANVWRGLLQSDAAQAQAEAAALRERQAAASAAAAKSITIKRVRDELRTPMAALAGATELLQRAARTPEARAHIGALVQANNLLGLVLDDLTDLDKLENGEVRIELKPSDAREIIAGVVRSFGAAAQDKGIELFLDIAPETPPLVLIDPLRVRQILFNLVSNAVRFTQHGGVRVRLQVQAAAAPHRVRMGFVVADTGAGLSRSQLALMLGAGKAPPAAAGLGLAISSRLARLMGAKLAGRSELGEGSVFSFVLEADIASARFALTDQSAA